MILGKNVYVVLLGIDKHIVLYEVTLWLRRFESLRKKIYDCLFSKVQTAYTSF